MTDENAAPEPKVLLVKFQTSEDINRNNFKSWLKDCPFSEEGRQALTWKTSKLQIFVNVEIQVMEDVTKKQIDEWLLSAEPHVLEIIVLDDGGGKLRIVRKKLPKKRGIAGI